MSEILWWSMFSGAAGLVVGLAIGLKFTDWEWRNGYRLEPIRDIRDEDSESSDA